MGACQSANDKKENQVQNENENKKEPENKTEEKNKENSDQKEFNENENKYLNIKDSFKKIHFEINEKYKTIETLLDERDSLIERGKPKDFVDKRKIESNVQTMLEDLKERLYNLKLEYKAQKNKPNLYKDIDKKKEILDLFEEKYTIYQERLKNLPEKINNKNNAQKINRVKSLEEFLSESKPVENNDNNNNEPIQEEIDKMKEWDQIKLEQDADLDELNKAVIGLKNQAILTNEGIKEGANIIEEKNKHIVTTKDNVAKNEKRTRKLIDKL